MNAQGCRNSHRPGRPKVKEGNVRRSRAWSRARLFGMVLAVVGIMAACTTAPPVDNSPGTLVVLVNGLPAGASGAVTITGPSSFAEQLTASETLAGLTVGSFTVAAANVSFEGIDYAATVTGSPANVTPNGVTTATVTYAATSVAPGDLTVTISGLAGGVDAAVTVTGPVGTEQLTASART